MGPHVSQRTKRSMSRIREAEKLGIIYARKIQSETVCTITIFSSYED